MSASNEQNQLSQVELDRLKDGLGAAMALPFVDNVRDFVWEVIFSYVRGIDPVLTRSKLLFDVLDRKSQTGWSCKTLKLSKRDIVPGTFEYVIQRADVITKADALGYPGLSLEDDALRIGEAVLTHWNKRITEDARTQGVASRRFVLLLKNNTSVKIAKRTRSEAPSPSEPSDPDIQFVCGEGEIKQYTLDEIVWERRTLAKPSTVALGKQGDAGDDEDEPDGQAPAGKGLVGRKKNADGSAGEEVYIWYSNQKQLFEKFTLVEGSFKVVRFQNSYAAANCENCGIVERGT